MLCLHQIAMIKLQLDYTKEKVCSEFSMPWTLEQAAPTKDLTAPSLLISKDLSILLFLFLILASSKVRLSLRLLSVLSQMILNGFTCNRSLIENEFLSQIHSLIVDRVNWVSSSYLCKV